MVLNKTYLGNLVVNKIYLGNNLLSHIDITFTINSTAMTSAGVYDALGYKVRELWSGVKYDAGTYTIKWDGTDDDFNTLPNTDYTIKILANNVQYTWEGVIGNTSDAFSGTTVLHSGETMNALTVTGTTAYCALGFGEASPSRYKFDISNPHQKSYLVYPQETGAERCLFVKNDDTNLYWGMNDNWTVNSNTFFIYATKISDGSKVAFTNAVSYNTANGNLFYPTLDKLAPIGSQTFTYSGSMSFTLSETREFGVSNIVITGSGGYSQTINYSIFSMSISGNVITILQNLPTIPSGATIVINYYPKADITGLAVSASYIYVSHRGLNEIHVFNKTSGALVQNIAITSPGAIDADTNGNIWVVSNNTLGKYSINSDGSITATGTTISGLLQPQEVKVSNDGTYIAVCDAGTSQQIKAFNNTTGVSIWTLGQVGGYQSNSAVANDKFYFSDLRGNYPSSIAFQSDGSFWVVDYGNYRVQHFSSSRTFIENIQYIPTLYGIGVDGNNINRVFAYYLEFAVDYTKTLDNGTNGSWTFTHNWGALVQPLWDNLFLKIIDVCTLSNGRTYASVGSINSFNMQIVELVPNGTIRYTGIIYAHQYYVADGPQIKQLYPDGSFYTAPYVAVANKTRVWTKIPLTGFDSSNNPIWGAEQTIASIANTVLTDPFYSGNTNTGVAGEITSSNIMISWDGGTYTNNTYHLGGIKLGDNKFLWKTSRATWANDKTIPYAQYSGNFPADGSYDIGNTSNNTGTSARAVGRHIVWGYHGEFWKQGQTNKYNHYYDNGLFLGQFGTTRQDFSSTDECPPGHAGNAYSPRMIYEPVSGNLYLYHSDESPHSGIHRWKISNLSSIQEQSVSITTDFIRTSELPALPGVDLMAGLPYAGTVTNGTAGWSRSPDTEILTGNDWWYTRTNLKTYSKRKSPDVNILYRKITSGNYILSRDLGTNTGLTSWKLWGNLWLEGAPNIGGTSMFFEVLDNSGKIIVQFHFQQEFSNYVIYVNNTQMLSVYYTSLISVLNQFQNIEFKLINGHIQVTYANYPPSIVTAFDNTAIIGNPKTFRVFCTYLGGANDYQKKATIDGLRFLNS